jgi:hypothetical protein
LVADCAEASSAVLKKARKHGVCEAQGQVTPDAPPPVANGSGNCGTDYLKVSVATGNQARIGYGFHSSLGPIAFRNLSVGYAGQDDSGAFQDASFMFSTNYGGSRSVFTGPGRAYASLVGYVRTAYGLKCELVPLDASNVIG